MSINLDNLLQDNKDLVNKEIIIETKTTSASKEPKLDFDAIVTEWSYRCDKGYPDMKSKSDMIKLQEILDEMGVKSPFKRITEKSLPKTHKIFNAVYINKVYPKHGKAIMDAYRKYGPQSENLSKFGTATSLEMLLSMIADGVNDPLFKATRVKPPGWT
jgi:adenine-specific DNA methylase